MEIIKGIQTYSIDLMFRKCFNEYHSRKTAAAWGLKKPTPHMTQSVDSLSGAAHPPGSAQRLSEEAEVMTNKQHDNGHPMGPKKKISNVTAGYGILEDTVQKGFFRAALSHLPSKWKKCNCFQQIGIVIQSEEGLVIRLRASGLQVSRFVAKCSPQAMNLENWSNWLHMAVDEVWTSCICAVQTLSKIWIFCYIPLLPLAINALQRKNR